MNFSKAHGLANDFLVIDADADVDYPTLAVKLCARHTGIGADGLLVLESLDRDLEPADYSLRIFNSDGSEAEMSGNGIRCAAAVLQAGSYLQNQTIRFKTLSGIKLVTIRSQWPARDRIYFEFEVNMGQPIFSPSEIPMRLPELDTATEVKDFPFKLSGGREIRITALSTGNPHCTLFVKDFDQLDWRQLGAELEHHPAFPNRTNVEFVRVVSRSEIETRFWERGAGETASSGTGASAAALASMVNGYTDRQVRVQTPAGVLNIEWREDGSLALIGPAEIICSGEV